MKNPHTHIGFVSTRLAGTDGVSLETIKWSRVLESLGYECFYFAGELEWPPERSFLVPEAHFKHPEIQALNKDLFDDYVRSPETTRKVQKLKDHLKRHLHEFVQKYHLELLIAENALSLPMNVPLALALTEYVAETRFPVVGHHHDFVWERRRYAVSAAEDYLRSAFPPTLPSIHHVVINSFAARQLALRTGQSSTLIPNVMDFDTPPPEPDAYAAWVRPDLGVPEEAHFLLQPTRIVPRKRIEHSIELARRLGVRCILVISHAAGDEGTAYETYLRDYAKALEVEVIFAGDRINHVRGWLPDGRRIFSLADVYQQAELVTYPSTVEGFGNAFLEAVYYRKPIVMNTYEIFRTDIQPKGFRVIGFEDFLTEETVQQTRTVLENPTLAEEMVEHNYQVGKRYYSYRALEKRLAALMSECLGE